MQKRIIVLLAGFICLAAIFAGCTGTGSGPAASTGGTGTQVNLQPSPTDVVPSQNSVAVTIAPKEYDGSITTSFDGGIGQVHVKKIEVIVYCPNGEVKTGTISPEKGEFVKIQGTKQADRVVVYVTFDNGSRLKTNDVMSVYRTR